MRLFILFITCCGFALKANAQRASVEESTFGVQLGILNFGIWGYGELKMTNQVVLRTELGFDASFWGGNLLNPKSGYLFTPAVKAEPRWYYNLEKREAKSKKIENNSGNFISLQCKYDPDLFVISNINNVIVPHQISIIPSWGIRRNIGNKFNYEIGTGYSYIYVFEKGKNKSKTQLNLDLRIGYRF